jgi:hypothetical protein
MARRYSPTGRFSQPDPYSGSYDFSDPQSLNRYAYVGNDPVNRKDPSGLAMACTTPDGMSGWVGDDGKCHATVVSDTRAPILISPLTHSSIVGSISMGGLLSGSRDHGAREGDPAAGNHGVCPPTGQQLAKDPTVVRALDKAWRESHPGTSDNVRREQGGWIYARNGKTIVRRGPAGTKDSFDPRNPPQIAGALLVATFHTHPGFASQGMYPKPNIDDILLANRQGVPGLVVVEGMQIVPYGPERRGSLPAMAADPKDPTNDIKGYPGNTADTTGCS